MNISLLAICDNHRNITLWLGLDSSGSGVIPLPINEVFDRDECFKALQQYNASYFFGLFLNTDEFWESNSSHWCGWSCRYTVAPALAVGAVVNAALACVLARRKLPLSANELFMLAIVLNELAYTVAFLCDYYLFGQFMQTYSMSTCYTFH